MRLTLLEQAILGIKDAIGVLVALYLCFLFSVSYATLVMSVTGCNANTALGIYVFSSLALGAGIRMLQHYCRPQEGDDTP